MTMNLSWVKKSTNLNTVIEQIGSDGHLDFRSKTSILQHCDVLQWNNSVKSIFGRPADNRHRKTVPLNPWKARTCHTRFWKWKQYWNHCCEQIIVAVSIHPNHYTEALICFIFLHLLEGKIKFTFLKCIAGCNSCFLLQYVE